MSIPDRTCVGVPVECPPASGGGAYYFSGATRVENQAVLAPAALANVLTIPIPAGTDTVYTFSGFYTTATILGQGFEQWWGIAARDSAGALLPTPFATEYAMGSPQAIIGVASVSGDDILISWSNQDLVNPCEICAVATMGICALQSVVIPIP